MTKRPSPAETNFEPQHKMHISEKEISQGPLPNAIHDKTLNLLFDGAKNLKSSKETSSTDVAMQQAGPAGSQTGLKQMYINNQYRLEAECSNQVSPENLHYCQLVASVENMKKCCFCEKSFCEECTVTCAHCKFEYCKMCSMCIYSADLDYICLGCWKRK